MKGLAGGPRVEKRKGSGFRRTSPTSPFKYISEGNICQNKNGDNYVCPKSRA